MARQIDYTKNVSFSDLDWKPGIILGLDNSDFEMPEPFILAIPQRITRGFEKSGLKLVYHHPAGEREEWTLHSEGYMLGLWSAKGFITPQFEIIKGGLPHENPYFVETAYSGKTAIWAAFNKDRNLRHYASMMDKEKLVFERGSIGKFLEKNGLESLLPNQLRLRGFKPCGIVSPEGVAYR